MGYRALLPELERCTACSSVANCQTLTWPCFLTYRDSGVFAAVLLGHLVDERLVPLGRVVVAREEIEHDIDLDNGVCCRRFYQSEVTKVPPRLIREIFYGTECYNFARSPSLALSRGLFEAGGGGRDVGLLGLRVRGQLGYMEAVNEMADLRWFQHEGRQEPLHLFLFA